MCQTRIYTKIHWLKQFIFGSFKWPFIYLVFAVTHTFLESPFFLQRILNKYMYIAFSDVLVNHHWVLRKCVFICSLFLSLSHSPSPSLSLLSLLWFVSVISSFFFFSSFWSFWATFKFSFLCVRVMNIQTRTRRGWCVCVCGMTWWAFFHYSSPLLHTENTWLLDILREHSQ